MALPSLSLSSGFGQTHPFGRCSWSLQWNGVPGLYAFARGSDGYLIYLGETGSFASRMPDHEVWPDAQRYGATDVYAMPFGGSEEQRKSIERRLIATYNPVCNTQHRTNALVRAL